VPRASATFPGRNGLIVFGAHTGDNSQLYIVRPNGYELRQVTFVTGDAVHPDWPPDGRLGPGNEHIARRAGPGLTQHRRGGAS
jgi:hypothetical protein